jgi:hypothetical protein
MMSKSTIAFLRHVRLNSLIFKGRVDFYGTEFYQDVSFSGSHFKKVSFSNNEDGHFIYTKFLDFFEMKNAQVAEMDLEHVEFNGDVDFRETRFSKKIDFRDVRCDKIVWFDTVKLGASQFDDDCEILINGANFHKLKLHWDDLKGHLKDNKDHFTTDPSDLSALVENYMKLKWFKDADDCFWDYKELQTKNEFMEIGSANRISNKKFWRILKIAGRYLKLIISYVTSLSLYGHGVSLVPPLLTSVALLFVSTYVYHTGGQADLFSLEGWLLSAKIFISSIPSELSGFCEIWSIFERLLGAILMVTFTVVLARKTLR